LLAERTKNRILLRIESESMAALHSFALFLLPFGLPRCLICVIHFGGRPLRFPRPRLSRSITTMASTI
jgi:hypothetical protein